MNKLKEIIAGRPVAIMVQGSSIAELELHIESLKGCNVCWTSLGVFPMMEQYILNTVDKSLDIVFDCATVSPHLFADYEHKLRLPRMYKFLNRSTTNLWCTSHGMIRDTVQPLVPYWLERFRDKIFVIDSLVPQPSVPTFMDVPNSVTLMIGTMLAGGASKIILFGFDGFRGDVPCPAEAYYHPEQIIEERLLALGKVTDERINTDTESVVKILPTKIKMYREFFGNNAPIYNCSDKSVYDIFPKIKYNELQEIFK